MTCEGIGMVAVVDHPAQVFVLIDSRLLYIVTYAR